jgi:hypothetical protein
MFTQMRSWLRRWLALLVLPSAVVFLLLLSWLASVNDQQYYGWQFSGSTNSSTNGWVPTTFDLSTVPTLGNLCGQPQVWIEFVMRSDYVLGDAGVWLDDVVIRKRIGGGGEPTPPAAGTLRIALPGWERGSPPEPIP